MKAQYFTLKPKLQFCAKPSFSLLLIHLAREMKEVLDVATKAWGVKVERVEVMDVKIPENLQRAMAAEAEAARNARAQVTTADEEIKNFALINLNLNFLVSPSFNYP